MDHALSERRAWIEEVQGHPLSPEQQVLRQQMRLLAKRAAALDWLGERWSLHPKYCFRRNKHHCPEHKNSQALKRIDTLARVRGRL